MITTSMNWRITFFNGKVKSQTMEFPTGILANFLHITSMIEEFGPALGKPFVASLGTGLFEIRAKGREGIGRSLYCLGEDRELVILHSFVKKSRKIPCSLSSPKQYRERPIPSCLLVPLSQRGI